MHLSKFSIYVTHVVVGFGQQLNSERLLELFMLM